MSAFDDWDAWEEDAEALEDYLADEEDMCPRCWGDGVLRARTADGGYVSEECPDCDGTGEVWE